jgi:hypothetical protein
MLTPELVSFAVPPIAIPCGMCGQEMKLVSVDPCAASIIYTYRCTSGHRHEIIVIDK